LGYSGQGRHGTKKQAPATPNVDIFTAMAQQGMANPVPLQDDIFTALAQQSLTPSQPEIDDPYAQIGATTQRVQPVTEKTETIEAQIQSANDPNVKTRFGVLATVPEQATLFANQPNFKPFEMKGVGTLWLNTGKIFANKKLKLKNEKDLQQYLKNPKALTTLLGIAEDVGNETRGTAVLAKDPKTGTELATGVVTNPISAVEQAQNYKDQFPNAEIEVTDTDVVTDARKDIQTRFDEWAKLNNRKQDKAGVDEFNKMLEDEFEQEKRVKQLGDIGQAAKEGRNYADIEKRQAEIQKRFDAEKLANPSLTVEAFNKKLQAEDEQTDLAKNPKYAEFLKETGLKYGQASMDEFNLANQASVKGANEQNKLASLGRKRLGSSYLSIAPSPPYH